MTTTAIGFLAGLAAYARRDETIASLSIDDEGVISIDVGGSYMAQHCTLAEVASTIETIAQGPPDESSEPDEGFAARQEAELRARHEALLEQAEWLGARIGRLAAAREERS